MAVDPTGVDLKRLLADDDGEPIVMLNLLRFTPGGRASYAEYARRIVPFLERVRASIVYVGDCSTPLVAPAGHDWDAILLVRYPSRRAFSEMVADPGYQEITGLRTAALEAAVLQPTSAWAA
jgi:uncharacterized protein (DUF1330 family)